MPFALLIVFIASICSAHPMDLGKLEIRTEGDRLLTTLKLHELATAHLLGHDSPTQITPEFTRDVFEATLQPQPPQKNSLGCLYLAPSLKREGSYLIQDVVITCPRSEGEHLEWSLPFLEKMSDAFQLMTSLNGTTVVANRRHPSTEFGESSRTFTGFVKMGMGHIGARPEEWVSREGHFQFPDGIDHIFFVLALVLAGGTLWGLFKTATGFTLGHSVTLALSTYKLIHIHSKWIEAGIAFSIAYVAGRAFWKKGSRAENWIVAGLFGIVHGLGFSAALQDLELSRSETLTALAGFNIGVEIGQCIYILIFLGALWALAKVSKRGEAIIQRTAALIVCLVGLYWFYYRGFV